MKNPDTTTVTPTGPDTLLFTLLQRGRLSKDVCSIRVCLDVASKGERRGWAQNTEGNLYIPRPDVDWSYTAVIVLPHAFFFIGRLTQTRYCTALDGIIHCQSSVRSTTTVKLIIGIEVDTT